MFNIILCPHSSYDHHLISNKNVQMGAYTPIAKDRAFYVAPGRAIKRTFKLWFIGKSIGRPNMSRRPKNFLRRC